MIDSESQYTNLIFHLKNGYLPPEFNYRNKRALRLKSKHYEIIDNVLFRRNYDFVLLRCLEKSKAQTVLQELQDGPAGGHFRGDTTAHKILHVGYYWPTLFKDTHEYVRKCKIFQTASGRQRKPAFPLQPVNIEQPFEQWGLDIIGEIVPHSSKQHRYILTATDYFTKWVEAIPLKVANSDVIIEFIDHNIITRFDQILKLDEEREKFKIAHAKHQQVMKASFDASLAGSKTLQIGDLVLKWDKAHEEKGKHTKFQKMWLGKFQIVEKIGSSTFLLQYLTGKRDSLPVNELILKKFFP
eukprot:PITA_03866